MKYIFLVLALAVCTYALTEAEYQTAFDNFKSQYAKTYTATEEPHRYNAFKSNLDFVNDWDARAQGFEVGINELADLTLAEYTRTYLGMNLTIEYTPDYLLSREVQSAGVNLDWRTKGAVTPVKNQGQCGSCWSFSATGSMEAAHFFKTGRLVSLSEQNLVDCSTSEGNNGCNGGWMDNAFNYVIKNKGIDTEMSYPYKATGPNTCEFKQSTIGATIASFHDVPKGSEAGLLTALQKSPVSVAIDAGHSSFQLYKSGVYYEPACSTSSLDHGVLAVGYGVEGTSSDYWIVKNSWGASWGMAGYIHMSRDKGNNCGIASAASYPSA